MKTIVILDNIYSADMIKDYEYLKQNLNMKKFNLISPLMFATKGNEYTYNTDNFIVRLISSAISIGNMYNEFNTIKSITDQNKTTIYFGMAHQNIKAEKILVVNKVALDAQEFLLDKYLQESSVKFNYIKSTESDTTFNKIEDAVVWLNDLQ